MWDLIESVPDHCLSFYFAVVHWFESRCGYEHLAFVFFFLLFFSFYQQQFI